MLNALILLIGKTERHTTQSSTSKKHSIVCYCNNV